MALSLGNHDTAQAAPTPITEGRKGRKAKTLEQQVAEADAIPWPEPQPAEAFGYKTITREYAAGGPDDEPQGAQILHDDAIPYVDPVARASACTCVVDRDASGEWSGEPAPHCPIHGDDGQIAMTDDQMAELRARNARMGLGGPQEAAESPRTFVTDYDAKGEAIDVEIAPRAPQQPISPPMTSTGNQYVMPMFEGLTMDKVIINLAGRVELNYATIRDRAIWDALRLGEDVDLLFSGKVVARKNGVALDKEREVKEASASASVKIFELATPETISDIIYDANNPEVQALVNWAHMILAAGIYPPDDHEDVMAFIRAVADLGEPSDAAPREGLTPSDIADDNPVASALDEALAEAMQDDQQDAEE